MAAYRLASGGFNGDPVAALAAAALSVATYVPVVFVLEEVFFRGLLDTYLHGSDPGRDRGSALYGSALWGVWHLPVMSVALGVLTIPYLIAIHTALGYVLVTAWRRTGTWRRPGSPTRSAMRFATRSPSSSDGAPCRPCPPVPGSHRTYDRAGSVGGEPPGTYVRSSNRGCSGAEQAFRGHGAKEKRR